MSQISKCPKLRVVLGYWEALGEVSEMRYNNLLYSTSKRSYCNDRDVDNIVSKNTKPPFIAFYRLTLTTTS